MLLQLTQESQMQGTNETKSTSQGKKTLRFEISQNENNSVEKVKRSKRKLMKSPDFQKKLQHASPTMTPKAQKFFSQEYVGQQSFGSNQNTVQTFNQTPEKMLLRDDHPEKDSDQFSMQKKKVKLNVKRGRSQSRPNKKRDGSGKNSLLGIDAPNRTSP